MITWGETKRIREIQNDGARKFSQKSQRASLEACLWINDYSLNVMTIIVFGFFVATRQLAKLNDSSNNLPGSSMPREGPVVYCQQCNDEHQ